MWNPPEADGNNPKRGRFGYFGVTVGSNCED
jgi:hypothetical protein